MSDELLYAHGTLKELRQKARDQGVRLFRINVIRVDEYDWQVNGIVNGFRVRRKIKAANSYNAKGRFIESLLIP